MRHHNDSYFLDMVYAKAQLFESSLQQASVYFKALSHPARLAILKYLAESKECITGELSNKLPLSRTTVNQHLLELKNAGLLKSHSAQGRTYYCLDMAQIFIMHEALNAFTNTLLISDYNCKP